MMPKMKHFALISLSIAYLLLGSCGNSPTHSAEGDTLTSAHNAVHDHEGEHTYTCPMHPEISAHGPGKCSKCGMALEHTDAPSDHAKYRINLQKDAEVIVAGVPANIRFVPEKEGEPGVPVVLELHHEKKMHVMLLSKDLSFFRHVHPEFTGNGIYELQLLAANADPKLENSTNKVILPFGGEFFWFIDYEPAGAPGRVDRILMNVVGQDKPPVNYTKESLSFKGNGFEVTCTPHADGTLDFAVSKSGKPLQNLDPWLGAPGHLALLPLDAEKMLHSHPEDEATRGPILSFHTEMESGKTYRAFLQFKHEGTLQVADFTIVRK